MGVSLAEKLALEGKRVTLVTPFATVGPYLAFTAEAPHVHRRLDELGIDVATNLVLREVAPGTTAASPLSDETRRVEWNADGLVLVTQRLSSDQLFRELRGDPVRLQREGISGLYRIGDCLEPRLIADCIFDGHRLAREIDSEDPASPRPFVRENVVLTTLERPAPTAQLLDITA